MNNDGIEKNKAEIDELKDQVGKRRLDDKTEEQTALEAKVERLEAKNGALEAKNGALEEKMAVIEAKFAALEAKLTAA